MILINMRWCISLLLLFIAINVSGQCVVSGNITNVNNRGIEGSRMVLVSADSTITITADNVGSFKTTLPAGDYKFRIEAAGYKSLNGSITFFDGDTAELGNIVMHVDETQPKKTQTLEQCIISGIVSDIDNNPIEFGAVRFLTNDSVFVTGVATDEHGHFKASLPSKGDYSVFVSALGYIPATISVKADCDSICLSPVVLKGNANELAEVTVSAGYISRVDGYLQIIPEKILVKHSTTGYQLLNNLMLPGLGVDQFEGTVQLYGHEVSLYINGQPADFRMIQNLRPKDVLKIEYHDAPVGRYSTDFAAINFITKERTSGGYVTLDAQQTIGGYLDGKYNGFTKINDRNTSYYLFGGYNLKNAVADRTRKTEEFDLQSMTVDRSFELSDGRDRNHGEYVQFMAQNRSAGRFINVSAGVVANRVVSTSIGQTIYSEPLNIMQSTSSRKTNKAVSPKLSYFGQFDLRGKDLLITTLNASYSNSKYDYNYIADGAEVISDTRDKMINLQAQLIYQMSLKHLNSLSFILMDVFKVASTEYVGTYGSKQRLWNSEALALVEYTQRVSDKFRFSARPGVSIVNMGLNGHEQKNFYFPRLFTQFTYNPARRQQINMSISIGNAMASLSSRTTAEQPIDLIMSRRGNPDLKDVKLYDANVNYSIQVGKVNINSLLGLSYNSDALSAAYVAENDRLVINVCNGSFKQARFSPNATWKVNDAFRCEFGGELGHVSYSNSYDNRQLNYASASMSFLYLINDFSFNLKANTVNRSLNSQYCYSLIPANVQFSAAWTHGNWRVDAWAKSLSRQTMKRQITAADYRMWQFSHGRFCCMVKVAYTFEFGRKVQRENRKANTSIESNIL